MQVRELTRIKRDQDKRAVRWPELLRNRDNRGLFFGSSWFFLFFLWWAALGRYALFSAVGGYL